MITSPVSTEVAGLTLTEGQQAALNHLHSAVENQLNASLIGAAGTGKTTLLGEFIHQLGHLTIMCATPTHKAAAVLRSKIPPDIEVVTVASLLGLKPMHRGKATIFVPDWNHSRARQRLADVDLLICDEASMISQALGADLAKACRENGTTLVMVGDAAQLPPVDGEVDDEDDDDETAGERQAAAAARGRMAREFLEPDAGAAALTEVVRHQGPVLELATRIRNCNNLAEINRHWPAVSTNDPQSFVKVWVNQTAWLNAATESIAHPRWRYRPDQARIVCWTNREVNSLTAAVRNRMFGSVASEGWQVGEVISNGDAIPTPGLSLERPLAPSSCEWIVTDVSDLVFDLITGTCHWTTPARGDAREFDISSDGIPLQRLRIEPLFAGPGQAPLTIMAPRSGDRSWHDRLSEIARQINHVPKEQKAARRQAWRDWHTLRSYVSDIRSAAVMTIHRSQGSSFSQVWLSSDLSWASTKDGVALHYTAMTRASDGVHLLRRCPVVDPPLGSPADEFASA